MTGSPKVAEEQPVRARIVAGQGTFGGIVFAFVQGASALILYTGANTSFNGFPFLASFVAEDSFLPRRLTRRGHRLVFSDGIPMTSKDVVFTFNWIMNPAVDCARSRTYLSHMESVTAEGDYRVVFKFKEFIFNTFETDVGLEVAEFRVSAPNKS